MHCPLCRSGYVSAFDECSLALGAAQICNENGIFRASLTQALIRTGVGVAAAENGQPETGELRLIDTMSDRRLAHRPCENCVDSFTLFRCVTHSMSPFAIGRGSGARKSLRQDEFVLGCDAETVPLSFMEEDCLYGMTDEFACNIFSRENLRRTTW